MAITGFRLWNFKCFEDTGPVELAPLTLVFGRNNVGKSSLLQSLLLLRQSLDSGGFGPRLNPRGLLYDAGGFGDLVHQHGASRHIEMEFTLGDSGARLVRHGDPAPGSVNMEFRSDEPQPPRLIRITVSGKRFEPVEVRTSRGHGGPYEMHIGGRNIGKELEANFRFPVNRLFPLIGMPFRRTSQREDTSRRYARSILAHLERSLLGIRAVGAFRQAPARRYEYQGRGVPEAPDLLGRHAIDAIIEDQTGRRRGELVRQLNAWLKLVGRVRLLPLRRISKIARLFELRLKDTDSGRWANFSDVGFGIGQALPVLVEGLRTPPGGVFIVQEPEIHLHPDAQLVMADFLITLAAQGVRVIAETHSDNIMLRVRHAIARRKGPRHSLRPMDVALLYVDKTQSGASRVKRLGLDEFGQVPTWPKGFMDETDRERMQLLKEMAARATE